MVANDLSVMGLVLAIFLLGIGSWGIKPNVNPLLAEQYTRNDETIIEPSSGKLIVLDREMTIQRYVEL